MKRNQYLKKNVILFVVLAFLMMPIGCNKEKKKYIIPKDDFTNILVDIHLMDGVIRQSDHGTKLQQGDSVND